MLGITPREMIEFILESGVSLEDEIVINHKGMTYTIDTDKANVYHTEFDDGYKGSRLVLYTTTGNEVKNGKCCISKGYGKEEECCEDDAEG